MEIQIPIGTNHNQTKIVERKDTASQFGSGLAEVFATPAMIAFMENTAYKSIEPFLPTGFSSVGTEINVKHTRATLPGSVVACHVEVTNVQGKKVHFKINVSDEKGPIGSAEHIRYIIDSAEFMARLKQ